MLKLVGSAFGVITCWLLGGIAVWIYADRLLLVDAGWKVQYAILVTGLSALVSLVVAALISLLLRTFSDSTRRPNFALLVCAGFVLVLIATLFDEYRSDAVAKTARDDRQQGEGNAAYQACLEAQRRRTLQVGAAQQTCQPE